MATRIGVIGAGGWGTALAKVLADKGERVTLWCHGDRQFSRIGEEKRQNLNLPSRRFAARQHSSVTRSLKDAVDDKALVICALPSHAVRSMLSPVAAA